ncbi:MAG TPA: PAS domain-containing protein [Pirellulales bacterium]|nr:PAS domain-containing protein [Pirellulales bacterium]
MSLEISPREKGQTADGMIVVDADGHIESTNIAAASIFGYALAELLGQPLGVLLPGLASSSFASRLTPYLQPRDGENARRLEGRRKSGGPVEVELTAVENQVGDRRWFTLLVHPLPPQPHAALGDDCDLLEVLMDNLPEAIYFKDLASRFIQVSRSLARRFGVDDPQQARGKTDFDFFGEEHARQAYANEQEMIASGRPVIDMEEKETWPDGRVTWASTTKMPLRDRRGRVVGTFGISHDITDRKLMESELEQLTRFLDEVLDELPIMLFVKDAEHLRLERLNKAGERLLGFSRAELIGKSDYDLFPADEADFFVAKDRDVLRSRRMLDIPEEAIQTRFGERILHTRKIPLFDERGRPTYLVGISEDITAAKQAEEELRRAKQAAEEASRAKSEFLANVSHEIRTPMNGIIGMTELALDTDLTSQQREFLSMVRDSADGLLSVINDILDFSKIEAGKLDLESLAFPLRDTLGDTMKTLALRAHRKGLELACQVLADVPDGLAGDAARLRQIVVNIVGNAIKFTDAGEVVMRVEREAHGAALHDGGQVAAALRDAESSSPTEGERNSPPRSVGATWDENVVLHFAVRDTGIGISPDKQQSIFAPFVQADGSTTRRFGGTGLGLAISARLVELMGGRIWLESEPGRGSTFHFTARFAVASTPLASAISASPVDLQDLRVLVVDDNATNRRILEEMLRNWHMQATVVASADEALGEMERACAAGEPYPLVLLDALMPGVDGYELARRINDDLKYAGATIMMLSSSDPLSRDQQPRLAASLMKPIKQSELFDAIMTSLGVSLRQEEKPASVAAPASRRLRILLAEDNAVNQKFVRHVLEKRGHDVEVVSNGRAALSAIETGRFDLVLMDVQMPELSGFEATAEIRGRERAGGGRLPIIAMTAHAMKGDRERCLAAGMDEYISKPIQAGRLLELVECAAAGDACCRRGTASDESPCFDARQALARVAGDEELLQELIRTFVDEWPRWRGALNAAAASADWEQVRRLGHTVKGALGHFGIVSAQDAASRLEALTDDCDAVEAGRACASLVADVEHVLPQLEALDRSLT